MCWEESAERIDKGEEKGLSRKGGGNGMTFFRGEKLDVTVEEGKEERLPTN